MKNKYIVPVLLGACTILALSSCGSSNSIPKKAKAVTNFDKSKYLGTWYEIARLDFKFEKNLNNTTAQYSLNTDGTIKVDNKGFNYKKNKWVESIGKAKFVSDEKLAMLKVSFFGPFYSGYNVVAIDADYQYALIMGENLDYLWILSRKTTIPSTIKDDYVIKAKQVGYDTSKLIWVKHDRN